MAIHNTTRSTMPLIGAVLGMSITFIAIIALIAIISGDKQSTTATSVSAEQQELIGELQTATRGDIIVDPSRSIVGTQVQYLLVRRVLISEKNGDYGFDLSPMNDFGFIGMPTLWNQQQLARANVRIIESESDEWSQVMRRYFCADPDSL